MTLRRLFVRARACSVAATLILTAASLLLAQGIPFVNQPLVPSSVPPRSAAFVLTVNGAQFLPSSVVNWNRVPLSTTYVSAHQLTAVVPASDVASASTASVTVTNPAPGGGTSNAGLFSVTKPTSTVAFTTSTINNAGNGLVVADFNNDGKPDLFEFGGTDPSCVAEYSPPVSVFLGSGDGTFTRVVSCILVGSQKDPTVLGGPDVAGKFTGNGDTDILTVSHGDYGAPNTLTTLLGNGDGTFGGPVIAGAYFGGQPVTGDFNRDGNLDFAGGGVSEDGEYPAWNTFEGNGQGLFETGYGVFYSGANYGPYSVFAAGDFNNDGILDLAVAGGPTLAVYLGNGDGNFTPLAPQNFALVNGVAMTAADFNGDGILDLAIADGGSNAVTILKGNGDGTFTQVNGEPTLPQFSTAVAAADLNGDGKLDLVFANVPDCSTCGQPANTISIFWGNGDGTFQQGFSEAVGNSASDTNFASPAIGIADFNGDGRLDLAVDNTQDETVSLLLQTPPPSGVSVTLLGSGNPTYVDQPVTYTAVVSSGKTPATGTVTFK